MALFCHRCKACDQRFETTSNATNVCPACGGADCVVRDYRSESQSTHIPSYMSSKNTTSRSDFLPSAKDFEKPGDADGSKGLAEWKDTHQLKNSRWV